MMKVDMHIHTSVSDGDLSPEEVVRLCKNQGLDLISITDHDLIRDYQDLSKKYDIPIVSGIEFNTAETNLHLLGYSIKDIDYICKFMTRLASDNEKIVYEVIELLKKDGFDVSVNKIVDYFRKNNVELDNLSKRNLVKYLIYMGYASSVIECYNKLLGKNQKYYVPNKKVSPYDLIQLVEVSGGFSVLAHPMTLKQDMYTLSNTIGDLKKHGLSGVERINKKMSLGTDYLDESIAKRYDLLETFGSDFHELRSDEVGVNVLDEEYEKILKYVYKR